MPPNPLLSSDRAKLCFRILHSGGLAVKEKTTGWRSVLDGIQQDGIRRLPLQSRHGVNTASLENHTSASSEHTANGCQVKRAAFLT
jgi:hypothetical protein